MLSHIVSTSSCSFLSFFLCCCHKNLWKAAKKWKHNRNFVKKIQWDQNFNGKFFVAPFLPIMCVLSYHIRHLPAAIWYPMQWVFWCVLNLFRHVNYVYLKCMFVCCISTLFIAAERVLISGMFNVDSYCIIGSAAGITCWTA